MVLRLRCNFVDADERGPIFLLGSFGAESNAETAMNQVKMTTRRLKRLVVLRIRCTGESVCLYRLRCGEVNGPRCLFRAAARKAKRMLFTADFPASSMQRIQHATSRRASLGITPRAFLRAGAP